MSKATTGKNLSLIDQAPVEESEYFIKINIPINWLPYNRIQLVGTISFLEYESVLNEVVQSGLIFGSSQFKRVVSIQRIENKPLYAQYSIHREMFSKKYSDVKFEYTLYHGTTEESAQKIWQTGFNRSYAGKNGTRYGKGVYFSKSARFAHNFTDRSSKIRHIFVSKCLIGKYEAGNSLIKVPKYGFDSTVDKINNPKTFVIYHDSQAYPQYLLTYLIR